MRLTYIFLICGVMLVSALQENQLKQSQLIDDSLTELKQSRIGRFLLKLSTLKSKVQQVDFAQLFDAIDELAGSLRDRRNEESSSFSDDRVQYLSEQQFYSNLANQYDEEVSSAEVELSDLKDARATLEESLNDRRSDLKYASQERAALEKQIEKDDSVFNTKVADFGQTLEVIDKVQTQLASVLDNAFIEVEHEDIFVSKDQLKDRLSTINVRRFSYEPLITALTQMSNPSFSDQLLVSRVLKLIQQLRAEIDGSRLALIAEYEVRSQDAHSLLDQYVEKIDFLTSEIIPTLQEQIENKSTQIDAKQSILGDFKESLASARANLEAIENKWIARQEVNKRLIQEYDQELSVLSQTVAALQRNGIKRQ